MQVEAVEKEAMKNWKLVCGGVYLVSLSRDATLVHYLRTEKKDHSTNYNCRE